MHCPKFFHTAGALIALALIGGCVSGDTPTEKLHSRLRARAVPPSDFLPNHELLVKQANHFPFHYFYLKENIQPYDRIYIAPVDTTRITTSKVWEKYYKIMIKSTGKNLESLVAFTHAAFEQAFRAQAKESNNDGSVLEVTDRRDQPNTLILEPALIAIAPTKAELNVIGTTASFFVVGASVVSSLLSSGSIMMECRIRDAKTGEIVAMYSNTEKDPTALVAPVGYSWTASTRINIKEIAANTAKVLSAKDYRTVRRRFPIRFTALLKDANLDEDEDASSK